MKKIIINRENFKQRIDRFLVKELFSYTRGEIMRSIKAGDILVNKKKVKPSYILKNKDELSINIEPEVKKIKPNPKVKLEIIYEDKNIIVINKPAGLQVHPSHSEKINTLANGLIVKYPEIKNIGDDPSLRPGIVHRLDKDTSGIMVVGRNQEAFGELKRLFQKRELRKEYLAVVFGKIKIKKGIIKKPIARSQGYKKQTTANAKTRTKIRQAVTEYEVIKEYEDYSLVKTLPKTGRMHQIRVHMSALGHPIVGDEKYKRKNLRTPEGVKRQFLHAVKLKFKIFGKKHSFEAPLPADFFKFIRSLDEGMIKG